LWDFAYDSQTTVGAIGIQWTEILVPEFTLHAAYGEVGVDIEHVAELV
jgi:hypothetical protein